MQSIPLSKSFPVSSSRDFTWQSQVLKYDSEWFGNLHQPHQAVLDLLRSYSRRDFAPQPLLEVQGYKKHNEPDCQRRLRQRTHLNSSAFSTSVEASFPFSCSTGGTLSIGLSLLTNIPAESLFVIFLFFIFCQMQFYLCLGFPNPISECSHGNPVLFPGDASLLPLSVYVLLIAQFNQQVLASCASFLSLLFWYRGTKSSYTLRKTSLKNCQYCSIPFSLRTDSRGKHTV